MKRLHILSLLTGCLLLASCADEVYQQGGKVEVIEGLPATVSLSYSSGTPVTITKADGDDTVSDLFVLIFDANGYFEQSAYFSVKNGTLNTATKTVKLTSTSGEKKVFAVANVTSSNFNPSTGASLKDKLDNFCKSQDNSLEAWKNQSAAMAGDYMDWSPTELLMSGRFATTQPVSTNRGGNEGDGSCLFHTDGKVYQPGGIALTENCKIWLTRTVTHITFNISAGAGITFEPESWFIHNLPKSVTFCNDNEAVTSDVFTPNASQFAGRIEDSSFNFFMLENRQANGTNLDVETREDLGSDHKGAYIVLKGKYKGAEKNPFYPEGAPTQEATASVTYFIHLGYIGEYGGADDLSAYRNHKYIYNVTVKGVNDIIVEAYVDNKETPRADGDVVFTETTPINVDAHYSRISLEFPSGKEILANAGTNVIKCMVKTAKTGFVEEDAATSGDIDWIYFVEKSVVDNLWNTGNGPDFTQKEVPGYEVKIYNIRELSAAFEPGGIYHEIDGGGKVTFYAYIAENYYDDRNLPSMFVNYESTTGTQKTRTMKIALKSESKSGTSSVTSARYVINQKPIVSIFDMSQRNYDQDMVWGVEWINENLPEKYYTTNDDDRYVYKAYKTGIAYRNTKNITRDSKFNGLSSSRSNGRENQIYEINNFIGMANGWKTLLTTQANESDNNVALAYAACMSRNRDENGDGILQENEIKWYLPAINQYEHYWIGTNAVPTEATLYPDEFKQRDNNEAAMGNNNLVRQTYTFMASGGYRYQADESYGMMAVGDISNSSMPERHPRNHIRCARNIGGPGATPVSIAKKSAGSNNSTIFDIKGYLTESSLRQTPQTSDNTLPSHNEFSPWNRLPNKLEVKNEYENRTPYTYQVLLKRLHDEKSYNPCSKYNTNGQTGWRPANEREVILFTTFGMTTRDQMCFAQTFSSLWNFENGEWTWRALREEPKYYWDGDRYGWYIEPATRYGYRLSGNQEMQLPYPGVNDRIAGYTSANVNPNLNTNGWDQNCSVYIRCVRDL